MRIISGKFRGRRVVAPANLPVRPTTDMAKESLFNYLQNHVNFEGLEALDLFAGTGNITFELISRGAKSVIAVDKHVGCVKFIAQFADQLVPRVAKVFNTDALIAIERSRDRFDFIFADPPYDYDKYGDLVQGILTKPLLKDDGILAIEHPGGVDFTAIPGYIETRHYGKVHFSFFNPIHNLKP